MTSPATPLTSGFLSPPPAAKEAGAAQSAESEQTGALLFPDFLLFASEAMAEEAAPRPGVFGFALPQGCAAEEPCGQEEGAAGDGQDTDPLPPDAAEPAPPDSSATAPWPPLQAPPAWRGPDGGMDCAAEPEAPTPASAPEDGGSARQVNVPIHFLNAQSGETSLGAAGKNPRAMGWNTMECAVPDDRLSSEPEPCGGVGMSPQLAPAQAPNSPSAAEPEQIAVSDFAAIEAAGYAPTGGERNDGDGAMSLRLGPAQALNRSSAAGPEPLAVSDFAAIEAAGCAPTGGECDDGDGAMSLRLGPAQALNRPSTVETEQIAGFSGFPAAESADAPMQGGETLSEDGRATRRPVPAQTLADTRSTAPPAQGVASLSRPTGGQAQACPKQTASFRGASRQLPPDNPAGVAAAGPAFPVPTRPPTVEAMPAAQSSGTQTPPGNDGHGDVPLPQPAAAESPARPNLPNGELAFAGRLMPETPVAPSAAREPSAETPGTRRRSDPGPQSWLSRESDAPATETAASGDVRRAGAARRAPAPGLPPATGEPRPSPSREADTPAPTVSQPAPDRAAAPNAPIPPAAETRAPADPAPVERPAGQPARMEPTVERAPEPGAARIPARDITLRLDGGEKRVEVRLVERRGEIHFAVRTPDPQLAGDLRRDLPSLAARLQDAGLRVETWRPAAALSERAEAAPAAAAQNHNQQQGGEGEQRRRQEQPPQQPGNGEGKPRPKDQREEFSWFLQSLG